MNIKKNNFIFFCILFFPIQSFSQSWGCGSDFFLNTWLDMKSTAIAAIACGVTTAKSAGSYCVTFACDNPWIAGIGGGCFAAAGLGYLCRLAYLHDLAEKTAIALKEQERHLLEEQARLAREVMERTMRIKEEQSRITLEIMQRNAKVRNNVIIGITATVSGIGIGYSIYHLYRSILKHRQVHKQEQDLFAAKNGLLEALATANHDEIGKFELPTTCISHACKLLALPGGRQALTDIVSSYRNPISQQPGAPVAMLAQPN